MIANSKKLFEVYNTDMMERITQQYLFQNWNQLSLIEREDFDMNRPFITTDNLDDFIESLFYPKIEIPTGNMEDIKVYDKIKSSLGEMQK